MVSQDLLQQIVKLKKTEVRFSIKVALKKMVTGTMFQDL
jgi:hypothetical protein